MHGSTHGRGLLRNNCNIIEIGVAIAVESGNFAFGILFGICMFFAWTLPNVLVVVVVVVLVAKIPHWHPHPNLDAREAGLAPVASLPPQLEHNQPLSVFALSLSLSLLRSCDTAFGREKKKKKGRTTTTSS